MDYDEKETVIMRRGEGSIKKGLSLLNLVSAVVLTCFAGILMVQTVWGEESPSVMGWGVSTVISGSMSGTIEIDDMIIYHKEKEYREGDIIIFSSGDVYVTHRITGKDVSGYVTKGDANDTADTEPVMEEDILGKVKVIIPKAGLAVYYLRTPMGMAGLSIVILLLIAVPALVSGGGGREKSGGKK